MGGWCRGIEISPEMALEHNFRLVSPALETVERNFRSLRHQLPSDPDIALSVQVKGRQSVYVHMYRLQALRTWYWNRSALTRHPDAHDHGVTRHGDT